MTGKVEDNDEKHRSKSRGKIGSFIFSSPAVLCDCECVVDWREMHLVSHVVPLAELSMRIETSVSSIVLLSVFLQYHQTSPSVLGKIELLRFYDHLLEIFEQKKATVKEQGED